MDVKKSRRAVLAGALAIVAASAATLAWRPTPAEAGYRWTDRNSGCPAECNRKQYTCPCYMWTH